MKSSRPDVVVTDLPWPEHGGVDIARLRRNHPEFGEYANHRADRFLRLRDDETISLFPHRSGKTLCSRRSLKRALTEALQSHKH